MISIPFWFGFLFRVVCDREKQEWNIQFGLTISNSIGSLSTKNKAAGKTSMKTRHIGRSKLEAHHQARL
jgi:hypothetical protein